MFAPVNEILELIRSETVPLEKVSQGIIVFQRLRPSPTWSRLTVRSTDADIENATKWINIQAIRTKQWDSAFGVYLGLDTLNMGGLFGHNVEIGFRPISSPMPEGIAWVFEGLKHGRRHLIKGLKTAKGLYNKSDISSEADYAFFLLYSGVVLLEALRNLKSAHDWTAVWGFHDGDLFSLARRKEKNFEVTAKY